MSETKSIAVLNKEISKELADPAVGRALLATTFKGLNEPSMRQAIFEGVMRGFKFKDFLERNVYAIPFKDGYSLVTSIDYARKIGMKSGVIGKSAPAFEMDGKKLVACTITIKRRVGQDIGEYTATVFFDEYSTGRNLWTSKPRTMLAKVAESHALRMACPEELSQTYTEEEFEKEKEDDYDREEVADNAVVLSNGDDTPGIDGQRQEIPSDPAAQKQMIMAKAKVKWPDLDLKDAKAIKTHIAGYTELELVESNYPAIIKALS